jgi:hypothetical protein
VRAGSGRASSEARARRQWAQAGGGRVRRRGLRSCRVVHQPGSSLLRSRRSLRDVGGSPSWERFDSCWARLDRAAEHLHTFGEAWAAFLASHPYRVFVEIKDDGSGVVGIRREHPFPQQMPLLVGEFLYELRATLDNCLHEVAVIHSGQNPPPGASQLQFPIYSSLFDWARNEYRLKHLSDEHRQMLERIQPYRAQRQDLNCLAMLNHLARTDRHRTVHLVGACVVEGGLLVKAPPGAVVTETSKVKQPVIDEEAGIATLVLHPWSPRQQVELYPDLVLEVEIAEMAADRPWGSLANRLRALHKAVTEYTTGLAAYALGYTEPEIGG